MNRVKNTTVLLFICLVLAASLSPAAEQAAASLPGKEAPAVDKSLQQGTYMDLIENFRVPVEKHPNGRTKTLLQARRAQMLPEGGIKAEEVRIELYDTMGELTGTLRTQDVEIDQIERKGSGKGVVSLEREGISIYGVGLTWFGEQNVVRIESDAAVELERSDKSLVEGWR